MSGGGTVKLDDIFHAESLEELRYNNATYRVDCIDSHCEVGFTDCFHIHQVESKHAVDVATCVSLIFKLMTKVVNFCKAE